MTEATPPRIWANKGEAVTCVNGHNICEIARDIYIGDPRSGEDFTNWFQPEPSLSALVTEIRCRECRGVWIRGAPSTGYQIHFGNLPDPTEGWR